MNFIYKSIQISSSPHYNGPASHFYSHSTIQIILDHLNLVSEILIIQIPPGRTTFVVVVVKKPQSSVVSLFYILFFHTEKFKKK